MSTPQTIDTFARTMASMFDGKSIIAVPTGFQAFFGNPATSSETILSPDANAVDIDIIKGNQKTAALVPRGMVSRPLGSTQKNMIDERFSRFSRKFPLSEEEGDISADKLLFTIPGEKPYEAKTRFERMRHHANKIHMESVRRTVRLFERLAKQSVMDGVQDAILDTANTAEYQFDFLRPSANIVTVAKTWNDTDAAIMDNIDAGCVRLKNLHANPDFLGLGADAMADLIRDSEMQGLADNRRYRILEVSTSNPVPPRFNRLVASGWQPRGLLSTLEGYELWMFTYHGQYENESGTMVDYLPRDQAILTDVNARADRYFGPSETLPMIPERIQLYQSLFGINPSMPMIPNNIKNAGDILDPGMFYSDAYVSGNWKRVTIRTQSAPIFATTQTDSFYTMKGLHT